MDASRPSWFALGPNAPESPTTGDRDGIDDYPTDGTPIAVLLRIRGSSFAARHLPGDLAALREVDQQVPRGRERLGVSLPDEEVISGTEQDGDGDPSRGRRSSDSTCNSPTGGFASPELGIPICYSCVQA